LTGGSDTNQQFILPRYNEIRELDDKIKIEKAKYE
jgi:hypothetical protein